MPVVAMLAVLGMLLSSVTPVHACSCVERPLEENVDFYDTIVIGTVTALRESHQSSVRDLDAIVHVETYYKGSGSAEILVDDPPDSGSCGFIQEASIDQRYVLFLSKSALLGLAGPTLQAPNTYYTHLCAGNVVLDGKLHDVETTNDEFLADLELTTGPGHPPNAPFAIVIIETPGPPANDHSGVRDLEADDSAREDGQSSGPDAGIDDGPREFMWAAAVIIPSAFLAITALAPWRRR